ncbi:MAG: hypothetical protein JNM77_00155 [Pseudonocardia sp.]|nr:hypothetical protein [Pseudonocardia sp.]
MPYSPEIVAAVWVGLRSVRHSAHRAAGRPGCGRGPAAALRMLRGAPVPHDCESCYDLLVDTLLQLAGSARFAGADRPAAYAHGAAEHLAQDRLRAARATLHGVARPERTDGTVGAIRRALAADPAGLDPGWADALLTLVLSAAATRAPLPATGWPYDRFAAAKADRSGRGDPAALRRAVVGDVAAVIAVVDRVAGRAWRDAHLDAPRRARAARYTDLRVGQPCPVTGEPVDPPAPAADPDPAEALRLAFWAALADHEPVAAARAAVTAAGGTVPGPAGLRTLATGWLLDLLALPGLPVPRPLDAAGVRRAVAHVLGPPAARRLPASLARTLAARAAGPAGARRVA